MNERAWFTLMVRGIGLSLLGTGVYNAGSLVTNIAFILVDPWLSQMGRAGTSGPWTDWNFIRSYAGGPLAAILLGAYLVFGGGWLIERFCREVTGRCARCGYNLTGVAGPCPECNSQSMGMTKGGGQP